MQKLQGECFIDNITIVNHDNLAIDLSLVTSNIQLFESIDQPLVSGRISIVDSLELIKNYKIVGQESLSITIRARDDSEISGFTLKKNSINRVFRVYSITDEHTLDERNTKTYVLHFIDPKYFLINQVRLSKVMFGSYSDMLLKEWRELCFKNKEEPANLTEHWEESKPANKQLVCPDWTLFELIDYVKASAKSKDTDSPFENDLFFFDTVFGGVNRFMSLAKMITLSNPLIFDTFPRIDLYDPLIDDDTRLMDKPYEGLNVQILDYTRPQRANLIEAIYEGLYSSNLTSYDSVRKIDKVIDYDSKKVYDKFDGLNPMVNLDEPEKVTQVSAINPETVEISTKTYETLSINEPLAGGLSFDRINPTNIYSNSKQLVDSTSSENEQEFTSREFKDDSLCKRNSLMSLLEQFKMNVTIPFRRDITAGTVITLALPQMDTLLDNTDDMTSDELDNGEYLITRVNYNIEPMKNQGLIHLQCVKVGFDTDLKKYDPLSKVIKS